MTLTCLTPLIRLSRHSPSTRLLHTTPTLLQQSPPKSYPRASGSSDGKSTDQPSAVDKTRGMANAKDPQSAAAKQSIQEHDRELAGSKGVRKGAPDHAIGMEDERGSIGDNRKSPGEGMGGRREAEHDRS